MPLTSFFVLFYADHKTLSRHTRLPAAYSEFAALAFLERSNWGSSGIRLAQSSRWWGQDPEGKFCSIIPIVPRGR